ncbi:unannotated protein [freshwater metagenome]|uniref:Unannotated protein n=1 Tax=freshwater metagenome TaxID=449393 RepID=A0A6J5YI97_9ZZZZ
MVHRLVSTIHGFVPTKYEHERSISPTTVAVYEVTAEPFPLGGFQPMVMAESAETGTAVTVEGTAAGTPLTTTG